MPASLVQALKRCLGWQLCVNADIAKLAVNTYVTKKISFANMLARLCEKVPGASVDVVTGAIGLDSRIGGQYLKGAISYGGPCFPRDNVALIALADRVGASSALPRATHEFNRAQIHRLADTVQQHLGAHGAAGILGPGVGVVREGSFAGGAPQ